MNIDEGDKLIYFWNESCSVCGPLFDKLYVLVSNEFPHLELVKISIVDHPDLRNRFNVYSSPLIILLMDGKEYFRSSGNVSIRELKQKIERLYALKFEN